MAALLLAGVAAGAVLVLRASGSVEEPDVGPVTATQDLDDAPVDPAAALEELAKALSGRPARPELLRVVVEEPGLALAGHSVFRPATHLPYRMDWYAGDVRVTTYEVLGSSDPVAVRQWCAPWGPMPGMARNDGSVELWSFDEVAYDVPSGGNAPDCAAQAWSDGALWTLPVQFAEAEPTRTTHAGGERFAWDVPFGTSRMRLQLDLDLQGRPARAEYSMLVGEAASPVRTAVLSYGERAAAPTWQLAGSIPTQATGPEEFDRASGTFDRSFDQTLGERSLGRIVLNVRFPTNGLLMMTF